MYRKVAALLLYLTLAIVAALLMRPKSKLGRVPSILVRDRNLNLNRALDLKASCIKPWRIHLSPVE